MSLNRQLASDCQTVMREVQNVCHNTIRKHEQLQTVARKLRKIAVTDGIRDLATLIIGASNSIVTDLKRVIQEGAQVRQGITERLAEIQAEDN